MHQHRYKFDAALSEGHNHKLSGITEGMVGIDRMHFHYCSGVSGYRDHTHFFTNFTSLPIKTEHGHVHRMEGSLEANGRHEHKYRGETSEEISRGSGNVISEAYPQP